MTPSRTLVTFALALALPLAACSSGDDPDSPKEPKSTFGPTSWDSASPKSVKAGGTLKLAIDALPPNFNDRVDTGSDAEVAPNQPTRGSAVEINSDGSWQVDKDYANSVELVDKDPQTVEVKLNERAVWQDGKPIVAADMIAWWKALNGSDDNYNVRDSSGFEDIKSVKQGKDRFSYTVTFDDKNAEWPAYIYPQLPASVTSSAKAFNQGYATKAVPGNGPFVISKIENNRITATRNKRWWGDKPRLNKIVYRVVSPSKVAAEFAAGKLDAIDIGQDKASYDMALKRENARAQRSGGLSWTHLTFNGAKGPLKDVRLRRAIAHAIDRKAMSSQVNKPLGAPAEAQGSMIYLPGQKGYKDNATPSIGYDTGKAEALLKSAGYTKSAAGLAEKDGKPLTLTITVPSETPPNARRAQQIQADLKKVGITVKLDTVPVSRYFEDYIVPLNFEMATFSWKGGPFSVASRQSLFDPVDSGQNFTGITSPKLKDLWDEANSELDPDKHIQLANDIDRTLYDYVPLLPIAPVPKVYVVAEGLVNYGASQFQDPDFTAVGFRK